MIKEDTISRELAMLNMQSFLQSSFSDVFFWRDIKVTGVFLSFSLLTWYLLFLGSENFVTPLIRLIDVLFLCGGLHQFGFFGRFTESNLVRLVDQSSVNARYALKKMYPIFTWEAPGTSLLVLVLSVVLSFISGFMDFSSSILFTILCAYTIPLAYAKNQRTIDLYTNKVSVLVNDRLRNKSRGARHADPVKKEYNAQDATKKFDRVDKAFAEAKTAMLNPEKSGDRVEESDEERKEK